ncbi:MAG: GNAT family N-acetyltransferase [Pseudomonadota bacterium]
MTVKLDFVTALPDPDAFEAMMRDYYAIMLEKLRAVDGPDLSAKDLAADTMAHLDELTPPEGRLLLATDQNDALLGCGVIRKIRPDAAELKRMFVRPEAQGLGLGRKLFELRLEEARAMGCRAIYVDTIKGNTKMLNMYENYGFSYIPRYAENANDPALEPFLVYMSYTFP